MRATTMSFTGIVSLICTIPHYNIARVIGYITGLLHFCATLFCAFFVAMVLAGIRALHEVRETLDEVDFTCR